MLLFWELWPNGLPPDYCDRLIERALELPAEEGTLGVERKGMSDVRRSTLRWLDVDGQDVAVANDIMFFAKKANRQSFGFDIAGVEAAQFTEYHATQSGKFDWHQDVLSGSVAPFDRKLSFVAQLSEPTDYEGGNFEFFNIKNPGPELRNRGAVLVFPSFLQHRVTPVTAGVRRSLVSWIEGPKFR
jgi:PKHD-type hydroxylase